VFCAKGGTETVVRRRSQQTQGWPLAADRPVGRSPESVLPWRAN